MQTRKKSLILPIWLGGALLLAGCAQFEARPLSPEQTAAAFEARSLDDPDLLQFIEKNHRPVGSSQLTVPSSQPTDNRQLTTGNLAWDLDTLTLVALYYNPRLDVARAQWAVAQAVVKTAGQRPNPGVSVSPQYTTNSPSGESPWVAALAFDGLIETAGKRGYRVEEARQLSESVRLALASQAWQVRSALRTSLLDYASAQRRVALLEKLRDVQQQVLQMLQGRLTAGSIATSELIPARTALIRTQADLADARRQTVDSRAAVALALGVPLHALEGQQLQFEIQNPTPPRGDQSEIRASNLRHEALYRRADLLAALADYAAGQSALQLEIARQYPDVRLGPGYEFDQGLHKWGLAVGTDLLPVFNRNEGPIAEAEAKRAEAAAKFLALQAQVIGEIDRALAAVTASREQLQQIDALDEAQRKNVQSVEATVKAGAADQLELRSAQLEAATTELTRLDAQVKVQQALGQLEDALQVPFEALRTVEQNPRAQTAEESRSRA